MTYRADLEALAGIREEARLLQLDALEPPRPGIDEVRGLTIRDWVVERMRAAALRATKGETDDR